MEITEQWIGRCAGGRVMQSARGLVKRGRVSRLKRNDGAFQGVVGGEKPLRVSVKVVSSTEIKNHCPCRMSQRTGALCEHAAAVLLAGIQVVEPAADDVEETSNSTVDEELEVNQLVVHLSPGFPDRGAGSIRLVAAKNDVREGGEADQKLAKWLKASTGQTRATILSLPEGKVAGFLRVLEGHERVMLNESPVAVQGVSLKPALDLEVDETNGGETVWVKLAEDSELFLLDGVWAAWEGEKLLIAESVLPLQNDLSAGDWLEISTSEWVSQLAMMQASYRLPESMGGITIREAKPRIGLEIAGSTRALQARLCAYYGEVEIPIGSTQQSGQLEPYRTAKDEVWWVRNSAAEQHAVAELMQYGFDILDQSGFLFLRGEEDVMDFLTVVLPRLRKHWEVDTEAKLGRVEQRLSRIVPFVQIAGSGEDWLECEVGWQCDGKILDPAAIRKMLMASGRSVNLPQGGKAVIAQHDVDVMDGVLLDIDPMQQAGKYRVSKIHESYLRKVSGHYGEGGEIQQCVGDVPPLPPQLDETLRDYQKDGVAWLYRHVKTNGAALLADDMGLGKTLQTLAFLRLWKDEIEESDRRPFIIACPASLVGNWHEEASRFVPELSVLVMHGSKRKSYFDVMGSADVIVTSYALLDRDVEHYRKLGPSVLVLDEASMIRNPDTLAAKAARKVGASVRIAITGTPVENSVLDLWSIFQFLLPGYLGSRDDFKKRYEGPCRAEVPDHASLERLRWRTSPHMLRRTKDVVAKDLPAKIESTIWCDLSSTQRETYRAILTQGTSRIDALKAQGGQTWRMQMLTILLRLRQSCCDLRLIDDKLKNTSLLEVSVKLSRLIELLDEAIRGGHRVIVFSQFTSMLGLVREQLEQNNWGYCYLDGSTKDRSEEVQRFQKSSGPPVFLISLKAGGYGLTLTAADTVVLFDPWWNPAVEAQAADRVHRIGQTRPATIYKLITRGTVEEKILRLQQRKLETIHATMSDEETPMMRGLSADEIEALIED